MHLLGDELLSWCAATPDAFAFKSALKRVEGDCWPAAVAQLHDLLAEPVEEPLGAVDYLARRDRAARRQMRHLKLQILEQEDTARLSKARRP